LPDKKEVLIFAPANRKAGRIKVEVAIYRDSKQRRHVLRHIELTAVLREILEHK